MSDQPERIFFSGDSLEQAVMAAARHYGCDPDVVVYERVEKRHGFIRTPRRVVIRVDPKNYRRAEAATEGNRLAARPGAPARPPVSEGEPRVAARPEAASRERRRPERPPQHPERSTVEPKPLRERYPEAEGTTAEVARAALEDLLELGGIDVESLILQGDGRLEIELRGPDEGLATAEGGRLLHALQHLLPRTMQPALGAILPCRVDCGNYQERREERLRELAQRVATEVREYRRPKTLRPMNPADRRIVHLALAEDPGVVTQSEGDGYFKRVTVRSA